MSCVRPVEMEDRAEWLRLRCSLWPTASPDVHLADIDRYFDRQPVDTIVLVSLRETGGLGGLLEVSIRSYAEGCDTDRVGYLEGWYVDVDLRRRGIGAALVVAAEAWAIRRGCTEMASDTDLDNAASRSRHQQLGYEEVEYLVHLRKRLIADLTDGPGLDNA